jgi:hypothetical protein
MGLSIQAQRKHDTERPVHLRSAGPTKRSGLSPRVSEMIGFRPHRCEDRDDLCASCLAEIVNCSELRSRPRSSLGPQGRGDCVAIGFGKAAQTPAIRAKESSQRLLVGRRSALSARAY